MRKPTDHCLSYRLLKLTISSNRKINMFRKDKMYPEISKPDLKRDTAHCLLHTGNKTISGMNSFNLIKSKIGSQLKLRLKVC